MKAFVMTIMALMIATVAVAGNEPNWETELKFTCPVGGTDHDSFDVLAENTMTNAWSCTVTVQATDGTYTFPNRPVHGYKGQHNLGDKTKLTKNQQCTVISKSCTLVKKGEN